MAIPNEDKERRRKISAIANEIISGRPEYGFDSSKISELYGLASHYDYMGIDARMMRARFKRYKSLKQESKKSEEWLNVINYVANLRSAASMRISDSD